MTTSTTILTAGEIAQYIQRPDEPLGAAIARFRNWEKTGIIKATGDANPGTGHKKQYNVSTLLEAVLLQELSNNHPGLCVLLQDAVKQISEIAKAGAFSWSSEVIVLGKVRDENLFVLEESQSKGPRMVHFEF